jgi:hydroxymethylpyrimidine/phosphomethylpyrimidine kinase
MSSPALVLCLSGHDPSGGAGLQADIEAVAAAGGQALGIVTALTVQDTHNVSRVSPTAPALLREQLDVLLRDCQPRAVKLGLLGCADQAPVIAEALSSLAVPLVCDPVLRAGGGAELASAALLDAMRLQLFARVSVLTPNAAEARRLTAESEPDACGRALLGLGCSHVLITGGDEPGDEVVNRWYSQGEKPRSFRWPRLAGPFHGAGCTLASAIAARLACGEPVGIALEQAQAHTQRWLAQAIRIGRGRKIPLRRP